MSLLRNGQRSNQGHAMTLHTYNPLTNVPTKYQLPTPYSFRDIAWTKFYRSRSLRQGQRLNQGHTMTLQSGQTFSHRPSAIQTPWVKTIPRQSLRAVGLNKGDLLKIQKITHSTPPPPPPPTPPPTHTHTHTI